MTAWWLSFADTERPRGKQFLGVTLIEAGSIVEAVRCAWAAGCNPGGQVLGFPLRGAPESGVPPELLGVLLTAPEATLLAEASTADALREALETVARGRGPKSAV